MGEVEDKGPLLVAPVLDEVDGLVGIEAGQAAQVAGLAGGFVGSLLKALPLVGTFAGTISMSLFSGATTYAIGQVFIRHFELGGTLLDCDVNKMKAYFEEQFEEGKKKAEQIKKEKS